MTEGIEKQQEQTILYVLDEIIQRANLVIIRFRFLEDNERFMAAFESLREMKRSLPGDVEDVRAAHKSLVDELTMAEDGAKVVSLNPQDRAILEVPKMIANFDEIVERVKEVQDESSIDDAISSATDSILGNEIEEGLNNIVLKHRRTVRDQALEQIELVYPEYEDDTDYDHTPREVAERIGNEEIFELLAKTSDALEELAMSEENLAPLIDVILDIREHIADGFLIGAPTKELRAAEVNRILYEKINVGPIDDGDLEVLPGMERLLGTLSPREEKFLRMTFGLTLTAKNAERIEGLTEEGQKFARATMERIAQIEAKALRRMGQEPPTPEEGDNPEDSPSAEDDPSGENEVISMADFKRGRGIRSESKFVPRRANLRKKQMNR